MTWPWQRLRPSDELIPCTCGSTLPALPQLPLANMVRRGNRIIRINTGSMLQCLQCQQKYFVKTEGQGKGLIQLQREVPSGPVAQDIDPDEIARKLGKRKLPLSIRDEMRSPP
jgi:hypothetical protein